MFGWFYIRSLSLRWPSKWNIFLTWTSIRWNSSKQLQAPHEASPLRNLAKALYWKSSEQLNPTHCLATALAKSLTVSVFPVAVSPQTKPPCNDEKTKCYKWFKIQRKFRSLSSSCSRQTSRGKLIGLAARTVTLVSNTSRRWESLERHLKLSAGTTWAFTIRIVRRVGLC